MLEDRGVLPEEDDIQLRECRAVHDEKFISSWLWEDVEGEKAEMERLSRKLKKQKVKVGRERWRERERLEIRTRCLDRKCREVLEALNPISEVESVSVPLGFRCLCLLCIFPSLMCLFLSLL